MSNSGYKIGHRVVVGNMAYTITNVRQTGIVGDQYVNAKANGIYVIVAMTIENIGKESSLLSSNDVKIIDSQGRTFESDTKAWAYLKDNILLKQIQPGLPVKGETYLTFRRELLVIYRYLTEDGVQILN